jgi:CubicO group peptidase (beta-lactamase class C family)
MSIRWMTSWGGTCSRPATSAAARRAAALAVLALLPAACGRQRPPLQAEADRFTAVGAHMEQLVAAGEVPSLAVAVARDGRIIYEAAAGLADRENDVPATPRTPYPLASISKPMTATALMLLAERGLIDLDAALNDVLGTLAVTARVGEASEATLRRAASHTAGLPLHARHYYDGEPSRPPPPQETFRRYANLVTPPGERFQYSNLGYGLLGRVIEEASGQGYAEFMRAELFQPLGMMDSRVHGGPGLEKGLAVKYTPAGDPVPPCDSDCPAAGAVYASAHDLMRFAMFQLGNRLQDRDAILPQDAVEAMQRPSPGTGPRRPWEQPGSGYGIGWYISVIPGGLRAVRHNGGTHGVSSELVLCPEENLAVAVLSNTHSRWPEAILMEILGIILPERMAAFQEGAGGSGGGANAEKSAEKSAAFVPGPELLGRWAGSVATPGGKVSLELEVGAAGTVFARLGGQGRVRLQKVSWRSDFPEFNCAGGGPYLRGRLPGELDSEDVRRGSPSTLWLELKPRSGMLTGSLIAFSQRENPTGPLSHWVELRRR